MNPTITPELKQRMARLADEITLRIYGDNVTMMRCAWLDMLEDLRPDCENARRIRARLADES